MTFSSDEVILKNLYLTENYDENSQHFPHKDWKKHGLKFVGNPRESQYTLFTATHSFLKTTMRLLCLSIVR